MVIKSLKTGLLSKTARNRHIIAIYARFSRKISATEKPEKRAAENSHILSPQGYAPGQPIQDSKRPSDPSYGPKKTPENHTIFSLREVWSERETDTE